MSSILRLRKLAGYEVPSFYEYARSADAKVKETPVELTEAQWLVIDSEYKGEVKGVRHILEFSNGALAMVPIKTSFIGGVDNTPKQEPVKEPESTVKDETKAPASTSTEANAEKVIAAVDAGNRQTDTSQTANDSNASTPEPKTELGAEKPKEEELEDEKVTDGGTSVKESAEEKAKKLISAVKAAKRITDTNQTQVDSNSEVPEKDHLGDEKAKECDLEDEKVTDGGQKVSEKWDTDYKTPKSKKGMFDGRTKESLEEELSKLKASGPHKEGSSEFTKMKELQFALRSKNDFGKVKESAEEIAKRIIASVKGHNAPHDAKNDGDAATDKTTSTEYNKEIVDGKSTDDPASPEKDKKTLDDKTGAAEKHVSVSVPAQVTTQIEKRIQELKAAKEEYDAKGYNDTSVKQNAIDVLEKIKEHLALRDVEGLTQAQVLFGTLMSPVTDLLPAALVNFLATARNTLSTTGTKAEA
jgi:hypothetical protein